MTTLQAPGLAPCRTTIVHRASKLIRSISSFAVAVRSHTAMFGVSMLWLVAPRNPAGRRLGDVGTEAVGSAPARLWRCRNASLIASRGLKHRGRRPGPDLGRLSAS